MSALCFYVLIVIYFNFVFILFMSRYSFQNFTYVYSGLWTNWCKIFSLLFSICISFYDQ